jgi:peptidyl-prolyl cis-trans isomerase SDCCAG10
MSSLYNLEPQPTASCILHTTSGDISLELWAQQIPLTSRNFLQLCLDGYYDNTIFHRLVPGFILQGGDPTGTGNGGESIYDGGAYSEARELGGIWPMEDRHGKNAGMRSVGFKDEWHSRIKYNRRGLLGMANDGTPDSNGSQFFVTLGNTPELQGKNTLFGRVEGETIYNVAKMGEAEVGEGERPTYPTMITSVEVLVNPFKDMVRRVKEAPVVVREKVVEKRKKRKGGKQLLSFGGEDGDEDVAPVVKRAKFDSRIVMDDGSMGEPKAKAPKEAKKKAVKPVSIESSPEPTPVSRALPNRAINVESLDVSSSPEPVQKVSSLLDRTNAQIAELKASMKRNVTVAPVQEKKKSTLEEMIPITSVKGRKRRTGANPSQTDEQRTLDMLSAFKSQLDAAPPEKATPKIDPPTEEAENKEPLPDDDEAALCDLHFIAGCESCKKWDTQADVNQEDEDDDDWMSHALSFKEDKLGKDLSYRQKALEELVVIDPREKARTLKEEMKAKRDVRSGVTGTGREWDQARNAKMAKGSALAGKGAR